MTQTTDPRKHLIPALFSWFCENYGVIHIHAAIDHPKTVVPRGTAFRESICGIKVRSETEEHKTETISANIVTLNFGFEAINGFYQNSDGMGCKMRFNGIAHDVFFPYDSIVAMSTPIDQTVTTLFSFYYGQESLAVNNKTMEETNSSTVKSPSSEQVEEQPVKKKGSHLRLVH